MKQIKFTLIISIIALLFTNCGKSNITKNDITIKSQILFQVEYVNHAWGFSHAGFIVDSTGNVYCFDKPDSWTFCEIGKSISEANMHKNFLATDSICYTIARSELTEMLQLLENTKNGNISEPTSVMADAGITSYLGFSFDENTKNYNSILIKQTGDWEITNSESDAEKLFQKLEDISLLINSSH